MTVLNDATPVNLTGTHYREFFRRHASGVAVITAPGRERPVGFTATSVISVSAEPPIVAFSIPTSSSSWPTVSTSPSVAIHLLRTGHRELSRRFATSGIDRFADLSWRHHPTGVPIIEGVSTVLVGDVLDRHPAGQAHLITVLARELQWDGVDRALIYQDRHYCTPQPLAEDD